MSGEIRSLLTLMASERQDALRTDPRVDPRLSRAKRNESDSEDAAACRHANKLGENTART